MWPVNQNELDSPVLRLCEFTKQKYEIKNRSCRFIQTKVSVENPSKVRCHVLQLTLQRYDNTQTHTHTHTLTLYGEAQPQTCHSPVLHFCSSARATFFFYIFTLSDKSPRSFLNYVVQVQSARKSNCTGCLELPKTDWKLRAELSEGLPKESPGCVCFICVSQLL